MDRITKDQQVFLEKGLGYPEFLLIDRDNFDILKKEYIMEMKSDLDELGKSNLSVEDLSEVIGVTICVPVSPFIHGYKLLTEAEPSY